MHTKASTGKIPQTYEFIKAHRKRFNVRTMCRVLEVAPSGYYAWLQEPVCQRALEDVRLLRLIRASYAASHGIYGAPRVFLDLREAGETCSPRRPGQSPPPLAGSKSPTIATGRWMITRRREPWQDVRQILSSASSYPRTLEGDRGA